MSIFFSHPIRSGAILLLLALVACENKRPESSTLPPLHSSVDTMQVQAPVQSAISISKQVAYRALHGIWIDARYWDVLRKTKSTLAAHNQWNQLGITELVIHAIKLTGDTAQVMAAYSNHEGAPGNILFIPDSQPDHWLFDLLDLGGQKHRLGYKIQGSDTLLEVISLSKSSSKPFITAVFRKIPGLREPLTHEIDLEGGLAYITNQLLVAGAYTTTDSLGHMHRLVLTKDGHLTGLPGYTSYYLQNDFTGPYSNLDYLILNINLPTQRQFAYSIRQDTLQLYATKEDTTTYKLQRGDLRYTLIRSK